MVDVRYDCVFAAPDREDMFPVNGVRSDVPCSGSSRSSRVAVGRQSMPMYSSAHTLNAARQLSHTIIWVNQVALHCVVVVWVARSC